MFNPSKLWGSLHTCPRDLFMTKELAESLEKYPLYSQEGKKEDAVVVAKFFFPATALTWYVTEGKKEDDDYLFFGLVVGGNNERLFPVGFTCLGED